MHPRMQLSQRGRGQALGRMSDKALPEWAPFAATLAQRLAKLAAAKALTPSDAVWKLALDHVLLRAVDTETQVHEEVLRLLMAAHSMLPIPQLAGYLQVSPLSLGMILPWCHAEVVF